MRIGIVTFHRANNLGAVLQASALEYYLQKENYECEIIDYYPNNYHKSGMIRKIAHYVKRIFAFSKYKKVFEKEKKYEEYRSSYMTLSLKKYYGDEEIAINPPQYDLLISGSDQIFNTTLTGNSKAYYLNFAQKTPKISYASSFGRNNISKDELENIKNELKKFQKISVREASAKKIIKEIIGLCPELVLDPVFLLEKSEWDNRRKVNENLPPRYIFVYSMEKSCLLEQMVIVLKQQYEIPVIVVRGGGKAGCIAGQEDDACGPRDFLEYIYNAEFVITNSFHGVAFSIIFEKKFYVIAHSARNARIESLMELVGKEKSIICNEIGVANKQENLIDGQECGSLLYNMKLNSKAYLYNAIRTISELDEFVDNSI